MAQEKKKLTFGETVMWYCCLGGGLLSVAAAVPGVPWRFSRVDTNVGNRFVMERYYTLMGLTNNLGKSEGWFAMRKKMQRKTEEFGRPSPLTALLGTVSGEMGAGGAAMGCAMWQVCKEHVNARYMNYWSLATTGLVSMLMLIAGALCAAATTVWLGWDTSVPKKKKKKDDACMEPVTKTMTLNVFAFIFSAGGVGLFTCHLGNVLKEFQRTAYYPFAGAHAGGFIGGFGAFLLFISMLIATNRSFQCCGKKKDDSDSAALNAYGQQGAYGAYPGAYGAYPGAYGAYPPQ